MAGIVVLLVAMLRSPGYPQSAPDLFSQIQDFPFTLHAANCQVLIYGDSSVVTGLNPVLVEKSTRLKTCNIAQSQSIVAVLGTFPVDAYLRENQAPKYLVIQLAPESFYREKEWGNQRDLLPIMELARHRPGLDTDVRLMVHYKETLNDLIDVILNVYSKGRRSQAASTRRWAKPVEDSYYDHLGWLTFPMDPETKCLQAYAVSAPLDVSWLGSVRRKYSALGMTVMIDASPIPDCDPRLREYRQALAPYIDHPLEAYPISMFNDLDRHFDEEGAVLDSTTLSNRILALESRASRR